MPTLIEHARTHIAACCEAGGEPVPALTDTQIGLALAAEIARERAALLEAAHDVSGEPRDDIGRWTSGGGAGAAEMPRAGGGGPKAPRRARHRAKRVARLSRFTSVARRRRVSHALANEAELARAVAGHNRPDSEAFDVVHGYNEQGELLSRADTADELLERRAGAVRLLRDLRERPYEFRSPSALASIARAQEIAGLPLHAYEVKTLSTSRTGRVKMSRAALQRKRAWQQKYAPTAVHTIIYDDRRGTKHSGHRLHYKKGVGSVNVRDAERINYGHLLDMLRG
jgi:hypothetical protein